MVTPQSAGATALGRTVTEVHLTAVRQDAPPKIISVDDELLVETDESDQRLELLHTNVRKYGTVSNIVAEATNLTGVIKRQVPRQ